MGSLFQTTRRLIVGATCCYCVVLSGLVLLWWLEPRAAWWIQLSAMFGPLLFAPLLLLLPLALALRSWPLRGAVALLLGLFLALFGGQMLPLATATPAGAPLRVMTFNHLYANPSAGNVVAAIRAQAADVVALQELSEPVAAAIDQSLRDAYPYQYLRPFGNQQGLGIISRRPFVTAGETSDNLRGQQVTLTIDGQTLTIMNMHLAGPSIKTRRIAGIPVVTGYDASSPDRQVGRLATLTDAIDGPLIVMGDFNTSDREPRYSVLAERMHDAFRETSWGFGFTFPDHKRFGPITVPFPLLRIDYVWSKNGVLPAAARVGCNDSGADHCFLVAELRLGAAK